MNRIRVRVQVMQSGMPAARDLFLHAQHTLSCAGLKDLTISTDP